MTEQLGQERLHRLSIGETVYFVGHERSERPLVTYVGRILGRSSVQLYGLPTMNVAQYPPYQAADTEGTSVPYSVPSLFSAQEVNGEIVAEGGPLTHDPRGLPAIVTDPATNAQLTEILYLATLRRQLASPAFRPGTLGHE